MATEPTLSLEVQAHDRAGSEALTQALAAALKGSNPRRLVGR